MALNGTVSTAEWFDRDTGSGLAAGLVLGVDGNIYGATYSGGRRGYGSLFSLFTDTLQINPVAGFTASGAPGGPFSPSSQMLVLSNGTANSITWLAGSSVPWLTISPSAGVLSPGAAANVDVNLNAGASSLNLGVDIANVFITNNNDGFVQRRNFTVYSGNAGFETGNLSGWTVTGDSNYVFVGSSLYWSNYVYAGNSAVLLGTEGTPASLSQTVATIPGEVYNISFWLDNPIGGEPTMFSVLWGGKALFSQTNLPSFPWTNMSFTATATGTSTVLQFNFLQDYDYFGLDNILVAPIGSPGGPEIREAGAAHGTFTLTWDTMPNSIYQVQYTANLSSGIWQNLGSAMTASGTTLSTTDTISSSQRFYRIVLQQ